MGARIVWIDWMKVISMYCIILGHFFPAFINDFLYAFNVPVFFVISGYLSKREAINYCYIKRICKSLLLPYITTCLIYISIGIAVKMYKTGGVIPLIYVTNRLFACIIGLQDMGLGCGAMWFVLTLFLIKLFFSKVNGVAGALLSVTFLVLAIYVSKLNISWSVTNVLLAYPFFYIGQMSRSHAIEKLVTEFCNCNMQIKTVVFATTMILTYIISSYNGPVYMFMCGYGASIFLFMMAAIFGTIGVFSLSMTINLYNPKSLMIMSVGTIVMLEFQQYPIQFITPLLENCSEINYMFSSILISAIIMIVFYPIINLIKKICPILIGR